MTTNPEPEQNDPLLDAVLGDDQWQTANTEFKGRAMGAFHSRQRAKRIIRWTGGAAVFAAGVLAGAAYFHKANIATPQRLAESTKPPGVKMLTDQELVAMFPRGSCMIVEVDGKKQLVFLDPAAEHEFVYAGK